MEMLLPRICSGKGWERAEECGRSGAGTRTPALQNHRTASTVCLVFRLGCESHLGVSTHAICCGYPLRIRMRQNNMYQFQSIVPHHASDWISPNDYGKILGKPARFKRSFWIAEIGEFAALQGACSSGNAHNRSIWAVLSASAAPVRGRNKHSDPGVERGRLR